VEQVDFNEDDIDCWPTGIDEQNPEPTCKYDWSYKYSTCSDKWSAYRSSLGAISTGLNEFDFYQQTVAGLPHVSDCPIDTQCMVNMGDEVVLIYWPPELASRDICAAEGKAKASTISRADRPSVVTMDAITFKGQDHIQLGVLYSANATESFKGAVQRKFTVN
jgi:hypothetical protein